MLNNNDSDLLFAPEEEAAKRTSNTWKVLIVDDEPEVHNITRMVLRDFLFDGKSLEFLSAHSARDARKQILEHPDLAVILLDVVMEEENAGLQVVRFIREEAKNSLVRIILRTGQPGQAPEERVIVDYDINDYKEKTELTAQKLFTTMTTALRSHRDLLIIEANRRGLEKIVESSANIFELQSLKKFATGVLNQLTALLHLDQSALYAKASSIAATKQAEGFVILAATGEFSDRIDQKLDDVVSAEIAARIEHACRVKQSIYSDSYLVAYFQSKGGSENTIYLEGLEKLSELDRYLVEAFCTNVSIAFDNIYLNEEVENTQKEIILTLGEIAEARSHETGNHVKRVAEYTRVLAQASGLPEQEIELLKLASPMHDIGKLAVPDAVLLKPGKLNAGEFEVIKEHAMTGYEMLKTSNRPIMQTAAIIAREHHEKWNGAGYPDGKQGEEIHLYGRITALADVFDALGSKRVYKEAWELDRILELFKQEKGAHFDPALVDRFFEHLDELLAIRDTFTDC